MSNARNGGPGGSSGPEHGFQKGVSGNPAGRPRVLIPHPHTQEIIERCLAAESNKDPLEILFEIANNSQEDGTRVSAAATVATYMHSRIGPSPAPKYVANPIDVSEMPDISAAKDFLGQIAVLTARGELDLHSASELSTLAKNYIDAVALSELENRVALLEGKLTPALGFEDALP